MKEEMEKGTVGQFFDDFFREESMKPKEWDRLDAEQRRIVEQHLF